MNVNDFIKQLELEEIRLQGLLANIKALKSAYSGGAFMPTVGKSEQSLQKNDVQVNGDYNLKWGYRQKVKFIIGQLGQATSQDVADKMCLYETDLGIKRALDTARTQCSLLKKDGELDSEKAGKGYIFSLKK